MKVNGLGFLPKNVGVTVEKPSGLLRSKSDPRMTIENFELRETLNQAVEDAGLNVTERMALNEKFFPNGGGFELFPKNVQVPQFNIFYQKGGSGEVDSFTREIEKLKIPDDISQQKTHIFRSSKSCFQANLDNALKKLGNVLKSDK